MHSNLQVKKMGIHNIKIYPCLFPSIRQEDLGSISSEIQTLQEQSLSMNIKLKNRQVSSHYMLRNYFSPGYKRKQNSEHVP